MLHRRRYRTHLKHIIILLACPLLISSMGYALFSQELSISANSSKPAYTATPGISFSYDVQYSSVLLSSWRQYNVTARVTNIGSSTISAWSVEFDLPAQYRSFFCQLLLDCTNNGGRVTVNSGTDIAPGGSTTFTFSFQAPTEGYHLQNMYVTGVEEMTYQTISGLTVNAVAGSRSSDGLLRYKWTYTFTVTNNSGQNVSAWRIQANWPGGNTVKSMSSTVNYVEASNQLTILSKTPVANGNNFVFTAVFSSGNIFWTLQNYTIQGMH